MGFRNSVSIQQRVLDTGGRATGFDYLRIVLAVLIVCWHSVGTAYGLDVATAVMTDTMAGPFILLILPMFFTLSGFLVAGSLERSRTLLMFVGLRVIRIFPALIVEVLLSAIILGPILTTMSIQDYFSSSVFHRYFYNIIGHIQYELPGVFTSNPMSAVNGQLWTVPWELKCYISIAALTVIGAVRFRIGLLMAIMAFIVFYTVYRSFIHPESLALARGLIPGSALVVSFLLGVAMYLYSDKILWNGLLAVVAGSAGVLLLSNKYGSFFATIPIAYFTVYLGLLNPKKVGVLRGADYSYGVFLYGFVVQQAFTSMGDFTRHWWLNIAVCLPVVFVISAFSWHFVEKPALRLRKQLLRLEKSWVDLRQKHLAWVWVPSWLKSSATNGLAAPEYRK